jgi:hypothetical protein
VLKDNSKGPEGGGERVRSRLSSLVHRTDLILALTILAVCGVSAGMVPASGPVGHRDPDRHHSLRAPVP